MYGCTLQILGKQLKLAAYTSLFLNILEVGGTILEQKNKILVNFMEVTASKIIVYVLMLIFVLYCRQMLDKANKGESTCNCSLL